MKILLINPTNLLHKNNLLFQRIFPPVPPLSLMYLAAYLENAQYEVEIFDMFVARNSENILYDKVRSNEYDIIGISVLTSAAGKSKELSLKIKEISPAVKIVWGNIHATIFYKQILEGGYVDVVVEGEGEKSFVSLVEALRAKTSLSSVSGISFVENDKIKKTPCSPGIINLDEIIYPAMHLLDCDDYINFPLFAIRKQRFTLISGSRGCPYKCYFCAQDGMVKRYNVRGVEAVVLEIEHMLKKFNITRFIFADAFFPITVEQGNHFCELMIERGLHKKVKLITETRVDKVNQDLLFKMKEAGFEFIMYGLEFGSQRGIDSVAKNIDINDSYKAILATRKAKIVSIGLFVLGLPWETREDCLTTVNFAKKVGCDIAKFNVLIPYPGTKYFEEYYANDLSDPEAFNSWNGAFSGESLSLKSVGQVSSSRLLQIQRYGMLSFYAQPSVFINLIRKKVLSINSFFWGSMWILWMTVLGVRARLKIK